LRHALIGFTAHSSSSDASNGALVEVNTSMTKIKATDFEDESVKGLDIQIQYKMI
jgi:hypothetical protein